MSVIENPEEIDDFAHALSSFSGELRSSMSSMRGRFARLGETWRDPAFARFSQEFEQTMRALDQFLRDADDQTPRLRNRAEKLREVRNMH